MRGSKIGGASLLTVLGVICLATFMIAAAITWSTQSTAQRNPQEVSLGEPTKNEWDDSDFFKADTPYEITIPVEYNFHGESEISYSIFVVATAQHGVIESLDFVVTLTGTTGAILSETSPGAWSTGTIRIQDSTQNDVINVRIMPTENAMDLGKVSFDISAQSVD